MSCGCASHTNTSLRAVRGEVLEVTFRRLDGADMTDWTGLFTAKRRKDTSPTDAGAITASAVGTIDGITFQIPIPVDTPTGPYVWDVKLTSPTGGIVIVPDPAGALQVEAPVTNRSA